MEQIEFRKLCEEAKATEEAILRREKYWTLLRRFKNEFQEANPRFDFDLMKKYVADKYGIEIVLNSAGMVTPEFRIIDEQKYIIMLLKE